MKYGSLFTGIGGFDLGFDAAGMECVWQVEKDPTCCNVLARHWQDVEREFDVATFATADEPVRPNLICGGFPCQDLSVAGSRAGLGGNRSGLFFEFMRIVGKLRPQWVIIENVPGLASSWSALEPTPEDIHARLRDGSEWTVDESSDLETVVHTLGQLGYWWAYRVFDAQYFGLAQRRKRVFIVGHLGDRTYPGKVLFEPESVRRDTPPSRETETHVAATLTAGVATGRGVNPPGRRREDDVNLVAATLNCGGFRTEPGEHLVAGTLDSSMHRSRGSGQNPGALVAGTLNSSISKGKNGQDTEQLVIAFGGNNTAGPIDVAAALLADGFHGDFETETFIAHTLRGEGFDASEDGTGRGTPIIPVLPFAYQCHGSNVGPMGTLRAGNGNETGGVPFFAPVAFQTRIARNGRGQPKEITDALTSADGGSHEDSKPHVASMSGVRRLTPRECERLQGFPDDWTRWGADGKEISDSGRYKMCGNAVAVPCAAWIARRIMLLETKSS